MNFDINHAEFGGKLDNKRVKSYGTIQIFKKKI